MFDWYSEVSRSGMNWSQIIPFAALVVGKPVPANRPAMTRIIEQSFVGVVAAAVSSIVTLNVNKAEIENLKTERIIAEQRTSKAVADSEARLTAQIQELRMVMLTKAGK